MMSSYLLFRDTVPELDVCLKVFLFKLCNKMFPDPVQRLPQSHLQHVPPGYLFVAQPDKIPELGSIHHTKHSVCTTHTPLCIFSVCFDMKVIVYDVNAYALRRNPITSRNMPSRCYNNHPIKALGIYIELSRETMDVIKITFYLDANKLFPEHSQIHSATISPEPQFRCYY